MRLIFIYINADKQDNSHHCNYSNFCIHNYLASLT